MTAAKLALCAALLAMASCGSNDAGLLADDPLATSDIEDLEQLSGSTVDSSGPDIKETYPTYLRTLRVPPEMTGDEALDRAGELAEGTGWSVERRTPDGFSGAKQIDGRQATVKAVVTGTAGERELTLVTRSGPPSRLGTPRWRPLAQPVLCHLPFPRLLRTYRVPRR